MNLVQKALGYTALALGTLGGAWGTKYTADCTMQAVKNVTNNAFDVACDTAEEITRPIVVDAVGGVLKNEARKYGEKVVQDMLIPPEIRREWENFGDTVKKYKEKKEKEEFEKLQKIFSDGKKKDPLGLNLPDVERNIKKR